MLVHVTPSDRAPAGAIRAALALALALTFAALPAGAAPAAPSRGRPAAAERPSYRLYLAALAAAEAKLRLHETRDAREWLEQAPAEHRGWEWRYLAARADRSMAATTAHARSLNDIAVSPDGRRLATASADSTVRLWDAATLAPLHVLRGHRATVWSVEFSPDGRRLASTASDGTVRVWDAANGDSLLRLDWTGRGIAAVAWRPDGAELAACSWDRSRERGVWGIVGVWDARTGERRRLMEHGIKPIVSIAWAPDGASLAVGTWDYDVARWETATWRPLPGLAPPESKVYKAVQNLAFSPDGAMLAVVAKDGALRLWSLADARLLATLSRQTEGQTKWVNDVRFLPDGRRILTVGSDLTLRLWDARSHEALQVLHGHAAPIQALAVSQDGARAWSGDGDGRLLAWDLPALEPSSEAWASATDPYEVAFHAGSRRAATAHWGGEIRVRDSDSGREIASWKGHEESGVRVRWSPDGTRLATTGNDGRVVLWDAASRTVVRELAATSGGQITTVAFHPSGSHVAAPTAAGVVTLWSVPGGDSVAALDVGPGRVWQVAFSPDGRMLAAAGGDGAVRVWDWRTRRPIARLAGHRGTVSLAWRPDGRALATGGSDRRIRIWDAARGTVLDEFPTQLAGVGSLAWSPDGHRLAGGLGNNTVQLWDPATGERVLTVPYDSSVWDVTWSPDGRRLAVIVLGDRIHLLDAGPPAAGVRP